MNWLRRLFHRTPEEPPGLLRAMGAWDQKAYEARMENERAEAERYAASWRAIQHAHPAGNFLNGLNLRSSILQSAAIAQQQADYQRQLQALQQMQQATAPSASVIDQP